MKTLSIMQPFASLISHGIKDIENRKWKTNLRGKILIHASAKTAFDSFMPNYETVDDWLKENGYDWHYNNIPHSAIIGEVDIVDCVINHPSIWAESSILSYNIKDKPVWNWVLANPVLYDNPILNVKGKLSFWDYQPIIGHVQFNSQPSEQTIEAVRKMTELDDKP